VLLLAILYSIILIKLKTQVHPGEQSANSQQQQDRRNRNVLQLSIAIVTVFVLCWLPYTTNFFIIQAGSIHTKPGRRAENPRHLVVDKPPSKAAPYFKRKT